MTSLWVTLAATFVLFIYGRFAIWLYKKNLKMHETKFLKQVRIDFPNAESVYYWSISTSDEDALNQLKEQISRDQ